MTRTHKIEGGIFIFFLFFGPKIGRYIDTSIIASIVMILMCSIKNDYKIRIDNYTMRLLVSILAIMLYSVFVSILNAKVDITFYGRLIRSVFSLISISLFIMDNEDVDVEKINEIIITVLLIHAIIVIISSTVYINLQQLLRGFNGYNKTIRRFRSTGLMMGFDMSGLLCNLGLVLTICKRRLNLLQFVIFAFASLFTSRFSVLFLVVNISIYLFVNLY